MFLRGYPLEAKVAPKELKLECAYFLMSTEIEVEIEVI